MSEKRCGGNDKQTRGRGDVGTRRIEIPRKISLTPTKEFHNIFGILIFYPHTQSVKNSAHRFQEIVGIRDYCDR
ncbi:MAG: hypothetical protein F6K31_41525 [Symploca sp. SIO2G7]|nr:hypothetical protein [Symploca sp. SIO2G7]